MIFANCSSVNTRADAWGAEGIVEMGTLSETVAGWVVVAAAAPVVGTEDSVKTLPCREEEADSPALIPALILVAANWISSSFSLPNKGLFSPEGMELRNGSPNHQSLMSSSVDS